MTTEQLKAADVWQRLFALSLSCPKNIDLFIRYAPHVNWMAVELRHNATYEEGEQNVPVFDREVKVHDVQGLEELFMDTFKQVNFLISKEAA